MPKSAPAFLPLSIVSWLSATLLGHFLEGMPYLHLGKRFLKNFLSTSELLEL
jgi:hypothetical protein